MEGLGFFNLASERLSWLTQSQKVVTENVANADTAGYKARTTGSFEEMVSNEVSSSRLMTTQSTHIAGSAGAGRVAVREDESAWGETLNGNTVVLEQQTIKANEISESYQLASSLYRKGHELLQLAVTGIR